MAEKIVAVASYESEKRDEGDIDDENDKDKYIKYLKGEKEDLARSKLRGS